MKVDTDTRCQRSVPRSWRKAFNANTVTVRVQRSCALSDEGMKKHHVYCGGKEGIHVPSPSPAERFVDVPLQSPSRPPSHPPRSRQSRDTDMDSAQYTIGCTPFTKNKCFLRTANVQPYGTGSHFLLLGITLTFGYLHPRRKSKSHS